MVYLVNGKPGRIPSHPDLYDAKALGQPLYSPDSGDECPDHPDSPRFTVNGLCRACWAAQQPHRRAC